MLGDIIPIVNQVVATGTSAAKSIESLTGTTPAPAMQICSYPDGSRLNWPLGVPCPATNPSGSNLTSTEMIGLIALLVGGAVLIFLVAK